MSRALPVLLRTADSRVGRPPQAFLIVPLSKRTLPAVAVTPRVIPIVSSPCVTLAGMGYYEIFPSVDGGAFKVCGWPALHSTSAVRHASEVTCKTSNILRTHHHADSSMFLPRSPTKLRSVLNRTVA